VPSIYDLKPAFQRMLRPLVATLARAGARPNHITLAALVLSVAAGLALALHPDDRWPLLLLPAVLFVRMALNAIDGLMARSLGMASRLGAMLNELGDVLSDAALYLPLACVPGLHAPLVVTDVVLAVITEMAGVVAVQIGASRRYDGPMGKSDRAFVFGAMGLALGLGVGAGTWSDAVLALVGVLLLLNIDNRTRKALAEAGR
jgi:CDP-diacylglycerol--glycerol-3-phosphate 3-phosphatidyltransferase